MHTIIIKSVVLTTALQNVSSHKDAQTTEVTPEDQEHTEGDLTDQQAATEDALEDATEVQIDLAQFLAVGGTEVGECAQRGAAEG